MSLASTIADMVANNLAAVVLAPESSFSEIKAFMAGVSFFSTGLDGPSLSIK
ncbi:hypothetical protein PF008_g32307 [Phytophthora fragariae]|uniref:Uncharacterized protein n=1 Tax=Phytophthora fragariae TaxID=53985 RepID=A0A6G0Q066_9STRA|nr:hypothetical protein PF008_g32307 [Phytophthora fragariae]